MPSNFGDDTVLPSSHLLFQKRRGSVKKWHRAAGYVTAPEPGREPSLPILYEDWPIRTAREAGWGVTSRPGSPLPSSGSPCPPHSAETHLFRQRTRVRARREVAQQMRARDSMIPTHAPPPCVCSARRTPRDYFPSVDPTGCRAEYSDDSLTLPAHVQAAPTLHLLTDLLGP